MNEPIQPTVLKNTYWRDQRLGRDHHGGQHEGKDNVLTGPVAAAKGVGDCCHGEKGTAQRHSRIKCRIELRAHRVGIGQDR